MIKYFLFLIFIFSVGELLSQSRLDVRDKVIGYDKYSFRNPKQLANQINSDFSTELSKAQAIYYWIIFNVTYDVNNVEESRNRFKYTYKNEKQRLKKAAKAQHRTAKYVIKHKVAICDGYAKLFKTLCDLTNLKSAIISGTSKTEKQQIGHGPYRNSLHAWNAVVINYKWYLVDATWGAGSVTRGIFKKKFTNLYFMTPPELFFLQHYPSDEKWLLVEKTKNDFAKLPLYFPYYLKSNLEIISPRNGIIKLNSNEKICIKIKKNSERNSFSYSFDKDKFSQSFLSESKKRYVILKVPSLPSKVKYLNIFCNGRQIVAYKIKITEANENVKK